MGRTSTKSQSTHQNSLTAPLTSDSATGPLDQVSSADIAVHVARATGLSEADSVVNYADSVSATEASAPANTSVVAKPQVISTALPSRHDIRSYTAVAGDTVASIAAKFGVTSDSIRWSNSLTGNTVRAGQELKLPPSGVNGIVYTVKAGDTAASLADKYRTDKELLISFNDAEVGGLVAGEQILIPNGVIQAAPAKTYNYYSSGFAFGSSAVYGYNGYSYGFCTWWAATRRAEVGRPIPANLGHAYTWASNAARAGLRVDNTPEQYAVLFHKNIGGLGHVAFVEGINPDGSLNVTDMNFGAGPGVRTSRVVQPSEFGNYSFIH